MMCILQENLKAVGDLCKTEPMPPRFDTYHRDELTCSAPSTSFVPTVILAFASAVVRWL